LVSSAFISCTWGDRQDAAGEPAFADDGFEDARTATRHRNGFIALVSASLACGTTDMGKTKKACLADKGTWLKDAAAATASAPAASAAPKK
jgi:hypothetical protein